MPTLLLAVDQEVPPHGSSQWSHMDGRQGAPAEALGFGAVPVVR